MLTFNEIKTALISNKTIPSKVCLTLNGVNTPITGIRTLNKGELWCIPSDKSASIQVTESHTITIST